MGALRLRCPHQQASHRVPAVQGVHESVDLVAVPHVAPLEFGQRHVSVVDVVENGRNFHVQLTLAMGRLLRLPVLNCCEDERSSQSRWLTRPLPPPSLAHRESPNTQCVRRSVHPCRSSSHPPRRSPIPAISPCPGDEFSNSLHPATSNSLPLLACVPLPRGVGRPSRFESRECLRHGLRSFQSLDLAERVARARPASFRSVRSSLAPGNAKAALRSDPAGRIVVWMPTDT